MSRINKQNNHKTLCFAESQQEEKRNWKNLTSEEKHIDPGLGDLAGLERTDFPSRVKLLFSNPN